MPHWRVLPAAAFAAVFTRAGLAFAEVLDKVSFPWESAAFVPPFVALVLCAALAWSVRTHLRALGLLLAALFAALRLATDEWFTPDVGGALRAELTAEQARLWLGVLLVQAFAPLFIASLVCFGRVWRSRAR